MTKAQKAVSGNRKGRGAVSPVLRFWKSTKKGAGEDSCWLWTGSKNNGGYGRIFVSKSKAVSAHRFSYEMHGGTIPDGMCICHRCDTPACVNPKHLFVGTHMQNVQDKIKKGRQRQGSAHPNSKLTEEVVSGFHRLKEKFGREWGLKEAAAKYGVSGSTIQRAMKGETWAHLYKACAAAKKGKK